MINVWGYIIIGFSLLGILVNIIYWGKEKGIKEYGWLSLLDYLLSLIIILLAFGLKINLFFD